MVLPSSYQGNHESRQAAGENQVVVETTTFGGEGEQRSNHLAWDRSVALSENIQVTRADVAFTNRDRGFHPDQPAPCRQRGGCGQEDSARVAAQWWNRSRMAVGSTPNAVI